MRNLREKALTVAPSLLYTLLPQSSGSGMELLEYKSIQEDSFATK